MQFIPHNKDVLVHHEIWQELWERWREMGTLLLG